jgi:hypothetical protein
MQDDRAPIPFIVGVGRSGTTLLRVLLDAHPALAIPAETGWVPLLAQLKSAPDDELRRRFRDAVTGFATFPDLGLTPEAVRLALEGVAPFTVADGLRRVGWLYAASRGRERWGDKSPAHVTAVRAIHALLPEARVIHLIRDGRDVAASVRDLWFRPAVALEGIGADWAARVRSARAAGLGKPWYLEVRYEDLVTDPQAALRSICELCELPVAAEMDNAGARARRRLGELSRAHTDPTVTGADRARLHARTGRPPSPERIGRWREVLGAEGVARVEHTAGDLLAELGYV